MIYVTDIQIRPNPVTAGDEITIEVEITETFKDAKRYKYKYPYRYAGTSETDED